ncbi:MAG: L-lactate dehydrogenase [Candidatus Saccharimonadales bacterium]
MSKQKVFIVGGAGMVGASAAYALTLKEVVSEVVLIDLNEDMATGQAMDMTDAAAFTNDVTVRVGDYSEIDTDDIVVITGGAAQKPGQTRLELLGINASIIRDVVGRVMANGKEIYLVLVTNPVDVLTYEALKVSGLPKHRVLGTGTMLDSARLRAVIAEKLGVRANEVDAFTFGEHGDSSFTALLSATVGSVPLHAFPGYSDDRLAVLDEEVAKKAYRIIETKKSTYYGIGQVISEVVAALRSEKPRVLSVSSLLEGEYGLHDVAMSVPTLVSSRGVQPIDGYRFSDEEREKLHASAGVIRTSIFELPQE